jgi:hypothetical protein
MLIWGMTLTCPLCQCTKTNYFYEDKYRPYHHCENCELIFVPPAHHLANDAEKSRYDQHQNLPSDRGYRQFLSRLFTPLCQQLQPGQSGLDFGSGPGPTLSLMLEEAGYNMAIYDKYYATNTNVLNQSYDFITTTEVLEHLSQPYEVLTKLWQNLNVNGILAIMTKRSTGKKAFTTWHYKNDDTHICFFAEQSFTWLAKQWHATLDFIDNDVVFFKKLEQS